MRSAYRKTGVVLAAGFGSRLSDNGHGKVPKPLVPVGGVPLLIRTLRGLEAAGCTEAVIVLGFEPDEIRNAVNREYDGPLEVHFVLNKRFALQNGVSVLSAAPHIGNEFVLVMADHVVSEDVMRLAGDHTPPAGGATLLVDYRVDAVFDLGDATKVDERHGRIRRIGKTIEGYNCIDIGVFVCTRGLIENLQNVYDSKGDASLSDGVQLLAKQGIMHVLDIGDGFWQDVDTPEMLYYVESRLAKVSSAA